MKGRIPQTLLDTIKPIVTLLLIQSISGLGCGIPPAGKLREGADIRKRRRWEREREKLLRNIDWKDVKENPRPR